MASALNHSGLPMIACMYCCLYVFHLASPIVFLPQSLLETTIVPVIKNKCGSRTDSNNYRPIAIATITSKLLESVILMKCEEYLFTSDNQFGFKAHGTEFCICSLLEFIDYYKNKNTTVFVTFLDASKAFDRVNYWMLFSKLIDKNLPLFFVKLLVFWYTQQDMKVRWGNTISSSFKVGNGVKQGGILSPVLFNIYMDKLSIALNPGTPYGTYMSHVFFLHLLHEYNKKNILNSRQFYFR